ncbi:MAG TPA: dTDP-4-dehydrorhamnose 3,5-epimerase [Streptosporangiaceae bacterium]|jgi:dTDP-4-dehydrorhamnose 3,5-epimerase|nr:dTDP-4-dehydrorhamnose 3,5-epimerase [Streptosporangiaceae bacterium]
MEALSIEGAWVYTPRIFADNRGSLAEAYRVGEFSDDLGYPVDLRQVNWSVSKRGVIRGIHFTSLPPGQAKYVFCPSGALLDVIVDLRVDSPTFLRWEAVRIDETDRRAVYLEHGLGHAFMALSPTATAIYLCTKSYEPSTDHDIHPLDPDIGIEWPADVEIIMSAKDDAAPSFKEIRDAGLLPTYAECVRAAEELRARAAPEARARA